MAGELVPVTDRTVDEWAAVINTEWRKTVDGIINTGRLIRQALDELPHGSKMDLYGRLPFSQATAAKLTGVVSNASTVILESDLTGPEKNSKLLRFRALWANLWATIHNTLQ